MTAPRVSAVIPAWNAVEWIGAAIRSALEQDPPVAQVIVADDGSTDGTAEEADRFSDDVRVVRLPHRGQAAATNAAIDIADGDLVAILHADDQWLPEKTALQVEALERSPDAGVVYSDLWMVRPDGSTAGTFLADKRFAAEGRVFHALLEQCFVLPSATILRRRLFTQDGLRFPEDLTVALDYELWLRAARRCSYVRVDVPLVRRALRPDAVGTRRNELRRDHVKLFRRLRENVVQEEGQSAASLPTLDRRLAAFESTLGFDCYREGDLSGARRLLGTSLRRRPSGRTLALWLVALAGRPGRAAVAAARGWRGAG